MRYRDEFSSLKEVESHLLRGISLMNSGKDFKILAAMDIVSKKKDSLFCGCLCFERKKDS